MRKTKNKKNDFRKEYKDIVFRIGYYRNLKNLSARETSLRLGYSDSFINRIERYAVELKVSTLLDFLELVDASPFEFFYPNIENYEKDKKLIDEVITLDDASKNIVLELVQKLKR